MNARSARILAVIAGAILVVPVLLLAGLGVLAPISWLGRTFLFALVIAVAGLLTATRRATRWRGLTRSALAAMALVVGLRCALVRGDAPVHLLTLDASGAPAGERLHNRIVPERDLALSGSRLLDGRGWVPRGFVRQLASVYDRMSREVGEVPSALGATYLGLQRPEAFDLLVVEPPAQAARRGDSAAVFLHGYAGNVAAICWLVARAAGPHGVRTYCPSTRFAGDWWTPPGARTLAATLRYARAQGAKRIILLGLSNGARGAAELAPHFRGKLAALALLSGLSGRAHPPPLPILLLHGRSDGAVPPGTAARYLAEAGGRAQQVVLPGDHFILVTHEEPVRRALAGWLGRQLGRDAKAQ